MNTKEEVNEMMPLTEKTFREWGWHDDEIEGFYEDSVEEQAEFITKDIIDLDIGSQLGLSFDVRNPPSSAEDAAETAVECMEVFPPFAQFDDSRVNNQALNARILDRLKDKHAEAGAQWWHDNTETSYF